MTASVASATFVVFLIFVIMVLMVTALALEARASSLSRRKEMFKRLWEEAKAERQELLTDRAAKRAEVTKVINSQQKEIWALRARRTELLREVGDLKKENGMLIRAVNKKVMETKTPPPPSPNLDTHV